MSRATSVLHGRVAFLVGVRRSGTNWLRRVVDAHPEVHVIPGETYLLSHGLAPLFEHVQHGLAGSARTGTVFAERDDFLDAVRDLCDRILVGHLERLDAPAHMIAERTPDHVRSLDLVGDLYPDARVVHIIRDGRDVARSLVSQSWGPTSYTEAATEWVSGIEKARNDASRLDSYLEVFYEQLLADPFAGLTAIFDHLGVDAGAEMVDRALTEAEVAYNVDPASSAVRAAKWEGGLSRDQVAEVTAVAGELLAELGYDPVAHGSVSEPERPAGVLSARAREIAADLAPCARGAARRLRLGVRPDDVAFQREVLDRFDRSMDLLDRVLDDVTARRFDDLGRYFAERARVRVVDGSASWDERGAAAVERLATAWSGDVALSGRQVRGDVHPGVPGFTLVTTWEVDGRTHDRVLVVSCFQDAIDELTWYVLPRLGGSE